MPQEFSFLFSLFLIDIIPRSPRTICGLRSSSFPTALIAFAGVVVLCPLSMLIDFIFLILHKVLTFRACRVIMEERIRQALRPSFVMFGCYALQR